MKNRQHTGNSKSILLDVDGMKCGGCVSSVEKIVLAQANVTNASVNLVSRSLWLKLKDPNKSLEPILQALSTRGFNAKIRDQNYLTGNDKSNIDIHKDWWIAWKKLIVAMILLLISVLGHLAESGKINLPIIGELFFHAFLATIALAGPGRPILKSGLQAAINFTPSMDTLVGLGVGSAYLASLVAFIWPQIGWPCFFNEPVMLLGFVLLGRFLEERARFRTGRALKELAELQPNTARVLFEGNQYQEVLVTSLKPGDKIQLLAGDRIPIDGIVLEGNSAVDISSLTGEPLPLEAGTGTELVSGSLNMESTLIMEVTRVGKDTALSRIIGLVDEAQSRKAPIQGIADRVAGVFCYAVVGLSLCTFIFWWQIGTNIWPEVLEASGQGLIHNHLHNGGLHSPLGSGAETSLGLALQLAIAVLVVACPCALGLATPTVITVASGKAARHGWLFRGGDVIEMAASLKQVVFDKTGTLTIGRPLVLGIENSENPQRTLQIAASLEQNSRHPLAYAVLQEAERHKLDLLNPLTTRTYPGEGLAGEIEGINETIRVGKLEWLESNGVKLNGRFTYKLQKETNANQSILAISEGQQFLGLILINDQLRSDASIALNRLRKQGLALGMLSGDRQQVVQKLGLELGFDEHQLGWQLLPNEKLEKLKRLKSKLGPIAMVGDGINDAPALAESDLGISIGTGTQIAQETADLVLLGDRLEGLPEALLLARKAMGKIKQNLAWAFGYNLIALPVAAGLLLPKFGLLLSPPIAALLMAISSITVVINALSLRVT